MLYSKVTKDKVTLIPLSNGLERGWKWSKKWHGWIGQPAWGGYEVLGILNIRLTHMLDYKVGKDKVSSKPSFQWPWKRLKIIEEVKWMNWSAIMRRLWGTKDTKHKHVISVYSTDLGMYIFDFNLQAPRGITSISMDKQQSDFEKHGRYEEFWWTTSKPFHF